MGFMDLFKKDSDPLKRLMRMNEHKLREHWVTSDLDARETLARITRSREQYGSLIEKGRATPNEHEKKLIASDMKNIRQRIELLERDYEAQLKSRELTAFLMNARSQLGNAAVRLEGELRDMMKLDSRELGKALDGLAKANNISMQHLLNANAQADSYASGTNRVAVEEESPDLALLREPPATVSAAPPGEPDKKQKNRDELLEE